MPTWTNWSGFVTATPAELAAPAAEADVAELVAKAAAAHRRVRPVGAGHSFTPLVATDGVIVSIAELSGVIDADATAGESGEAEVWAGTTIADLTPLLHAHGLGLHNQGDIDRQAIAGACGTGTHGTGPTLTNFSGAVVGATVALASGELVSASPTDNVDLYQASRLSLGAVGIVTRLRLAVRPAYRLHERTWLEGTEETLDRLDERIDATRHYEFFWLPDTDRTYCKALDETDADPDPLPDEQWERIDHSHLVFPSVRDDRFNEMEFAVPAENGAACFRAIRELYRSRHPEVAWPIEYRTVAADDVWMSPANGRATVAISVHEDPSRDHEPLFRDCEEIFVSFGGRPHWGKIHYRTTDDLASSVAHWDDWWRVRDEVDPAGVFLNPHLRSLRGG
ncbi:MAG: D-arabinono-1,4-lactone oxidase [Acidimicrobiales bacterium]